VKLPNSDRALVEREKIVEYLLNPAHQYGASKASFFTRLGFSNENWEELAKALCEHGRLHQIVAVHETGFGPRYVVESEIETPSGRRSCVRTIWQFDKGAVAPRLITAYPLEPKV
jgi:hypothetical protein